MGAIMRWVVLGAAFAVVSAATWWLWPKPEASSSEAVVLARVDGDPITDEDVTRSARSMLGSLADAAPERTRVQVLRSLVSRKAMARLQESTLSEQARTELERKVVAERRRRLAELWLSENAQVTPPSEAEVAAEVERLKAGSGDVIVYEVLTFSIPIEGRRRVEALSALSAARDIPDWQAVAASLRRRDFPAMYRKGQWREGDEAPLEGQIQGVPSGRTTGVFFIEGVPHVARPLHRVKSLSGEPDALRERAANMLKEKRKVESARAASRTALEAVEVQRIEAPEPNSKGDPSH